MEVKKVWITPEAEKQIMFTARVSSNDQNSENTKLLNYCIKHGHWSVFEMANMCIEINTSRAISAQILRHRSFNFQEFSQRYAKAQGYVKYEARRQDEKNRQNSIDDMDDRDKFWFEIAQENVNAMANRMYEAALEKGIAKEQARFLLPMGTKSRLYMNGTIRSWIHYINLRTDKSTQLEHRKIAEECKKIFIDEMPVIAEALGWK